MKPIDISTIHTKIMENYSVEEKYLKDMIVKFSEMGIDHECDRARKSLEALQVSVQFYISECIPKIDKFRKCLKRPIRKSFLTDTSDVDKCEAGKTAIVDEYMKIVEKYSKRHESVFGFEKTSLVRSATVVDSSFCPICKKATMVHDLEYAYECSECYYTCDVSDSMFSYADNTRINNATRYTYERRMHFRDFINQYQGKQQNSVKQSVYDFIYKKIKDHHLESEGTTKAERFARVSKSHIEIFLKECNYSKPTEDLNLIYSAVTGAQLDNINHLEEVLLQDFDTLNALYDKVFIKTKRVPRKNFLHTQYVLYQLLHRHKHPCDQRDFNLLKTPDRKHFHDEVCSELFALLHWNFVNVF